MPASGCSVPLCTNRGGHAFPTDIKLRQDWLIAIRRDKWKPERSSLVCKDHFRPSDYIHETYHGTVPLHARLKQKVVPSIFNWTQAESPASLERMKRKNNRSLKRKYAECVGDSPDDHYFVTVDDCEVAEEVIAEAEKEEESAEISDSEPEPMKTFADLSTQTPQRPMISVENFRNDPAGIHFYTGLETFEKFLFVLRTLGPAAYSLNYVNHNVVQLSVEEQFFLVLIKLRQHKTNFELGRLFGISEFTVSNIVLTWILFMSKQWKEVNIWPSRDLVRYWSPSDFREKFPTTRVIIDGTECPIKKPKNPKSQQATFSTYKNRNTVKILIGSTPGGLISYVSPAYGGSTSDRQIVERSNLRNMCDPGDSIMADKGFNVQDLFATVDVGINIPTFFKKKNRMSGDTVINDRKIASKRVHIERIIGLGKTYKILTEPMSGTEAKLSSEIIFICYILCNFRTCIVSSDA